MQLLLFSDVHCDTAAARRIVQQSASADIVIGAGDFATCRRGLQDTIDVLREISSFVDRTYVPTFLNGRTRAVPRDS